MAQPDLIAEKLLHTDPQVGFGEASVLPYREHPLDTRGFEALERGQDRAAAREEARKKSNEDYFHATIKNLPTARREVADTLNRRLHDITDRMITNNNLGINHNYDSDLQRQIYDYTQATKSADQLHKDYETEINKPAGKYVNMNSRNGEILKNLTKAYDDFNNGDVTALGRNISANPNLHFNSDEFLNDRYGKIPVTVNSSDKVKNGALGQEIHGDKVSARFWTKDKNGNLIPGIDQSHVDELMNAPTQDPDTLQFRDQVRFNAQETIRNKALELKRSGDPRYKDLGVEQIASQISSNPTDTHYQEFNKSKLVDDIARQQLEKFQLKSREKDIKSGHAYKTDGEGSGNDNATLTHQYNTENPFGFESKTKVKDENGDEITKTNTKVKDSYSPHEIRVGGEKADKGIYLNAKNFINPTNNSYYFFDKNKKERTAESVGDKKVVVSRLRLLPFDKKTGTIIVGKENELKQDPREKEWKWVAEGMFQDKDKSGKVEEKPVMMLYDQVGNDLKEKLGIDLNNRDLSEITDHELATIVDKNNPEATPEQKVEIIKSLRGK